MDLTVMINAKLQTNKILVMTSYTMINTESSDVHMLLFDM